MKTNAKVLSALLMLLLLFGLIPQTSAFAVDGEQTGGKTAAKDGLLLSVGTDEDSYEAGQTIHVAVTVENTNDRAVSNAAVTVELPEGLSLAEGEASVEGLTIPPGGTYETVFKAVKPASTEPTESTDPTEPTESTDPTEPTESTDPTEPTESTDPTEPTESTDPTEPTESTDPTEPTESTDPTEPTESTDPTEPTEATTPTEPTESNDPTEPTHEMGPVQPTEPTKPTWPSGPTQPTQPTQPSETVSPSDKSSDPSSHNDKDSTKERDKADPGIPKTGEATDMPWVFAMILTPIFAALALVAVRKYRLSKKSVCLLLILSLAVSIAPIRVLAAEQDTTAAPDGTAVAITLSAERTVTVDGQETVIKVTVTGTVEKTAPVYTYREKEDGTIALTGYSGSDSALTIPATLDGKKVTEIGDSAFAGMLSLKTVRVPEGVTHIGNYAFECCSLLKKIYFPDSLTSIGDGAFSGCASLTLADMQDNVKSIGNGAFLCCDALVQLDLPEALTKLGDFAFSGCDSLASVTFNGNGVTSLPDRVFYGCSSLNRLRLPEKITSIGKRAFANCAKIENLYFAQPLNSLGAYAFENCEKLSSVNLTAEVIPTGAFYGCTNLNWFSVPDGAVRVEKSAFAASGVESVDIPASVTAIEPGALFQVHGSVTLNEENTAYQLIDGSLYTADGKTLIAYFPADPYAEEPQTVFTVPEGVEVIAAYALAESQLNTVILPTSLKQIDAYALMGLNAEEMVIPEGTTVDPLAFGEAGEGEDSDGDEGEDSGETGETETPRETGSVAGEKNLFRAEDYADYRDIANDEFDAWCERYLAYNEAQGIPLTMKTIPYVIRYKGEVVPHYLAMTSVQNRDPGMWAEAAAYFGDDFEQTYIMMNHGLSTELSRGKMEEPLVLYSGLYDSQLMAAAGTDVLPTQQQLVDAIGNTFTDPIMISTTTDPGIAAGFGETLFVIYASPEAMESLGAVCIDAVVHSQEKEILMNSNAKYRILDVGEMAITQQEEWDPEPRTVYRHYVKVELLVASD